MAHRMVDLFRHGWVVKRSQTYGRNYFYSCWTEEKQWELPAVSTEKNDSPKNDEVNHLIETTEWNSGEEMDWDALVDTEEWDVNSQWEDLINTME